MTEPGLALLEHAQAIARHLKSAKQEIGAFHRLEAGRVILGAPTMVAAQLLPRLLAQFKRKHPGIELAIVQGGAKMIEEAVRGGQVDVGIISDWRTAAGLHIERVKNRRMVACAARNSLAAREKHFTWDHFLKQPLILFPSQYYQRQLIDHMCRVRGRSPNVVIETDTIPIMVEFVATGAGIATLLDATVEVYSNRIAAVELPPDAVVPVALCSREPEDFSPAQRALWSYLKAGLTR